MLPLAIQHRLNVGLLHFQHSLRRCFSWFTLADDLNELAALDSSMKFGCNGFVCGQSNVAPQRISHYLPHISHGFALGCVVASKGDGFLRTFSDLILREFDWIALSRLLN